MIFNRAIATEEKSLEGVCRRQSPGMVWKAYDWERGSRNSGATTSRNMRLAVTIIGPGAGIHSNQEAWGALDQNPKLYLQVYGQSRGAYDRYPPSWPGGSPAPNL
ncbi:unnamed protein product, partial [Cladocopium goreaui]